jgi:hypothetical protein
MKRGIVSLIYLGAIAAAEAVTAIIGPLWGVISHFSILFSHILNSALVGARFPSVYPVQRQRHLFRAPVDFAHHDANYSRMFLALGLVPLMRILGLTMTYAEFSEIYWYLIAAVPLVIGVFAVIAALDMNPADVGLTGLQ